MVDGRNGDHGHAVQAAMVVQESENDDAILLNLTSEESHA